MTLNELLPELHRLSRTDKYAAMQFLLTDLSKEERSMPPSQAETDEAWLNPEAGCPVWSPADSLASARSLVQTLKAEALRAAEEKE